MGQFSWLDCVTGKQIVDDKKKDVYLLVPKEFREEFGEYIKEECYDGYGRFGGYDVYDLIADWNKDFIPIMLQYAEHGKWKGGLSKKDKERLQNFYEGKPYDCEKRWLGIMMGCYDEDNRKLFYPIKVTYCIFKEYERCEPSLSDPNQGWEG